MAGAMVAKSCQIVPLATLNQSVTVGLTTHSDL